jgi:hypothetical protein
MRQANIQRVIPALGMLCILGSGCSGGYAGAVSEMHLSIDRGRPEAALVHVNMALGVDSSSQLPPQTDGDTPLLLLERASLLQSLDRHGEAARDFAEADKSVEVLDFTQDDAAQIGQYLFSDDMEVYKAPPHEKLMINTLALISYLAKGDLDGARVEGRRLTVLQKYFEDASPEESALYGVGSYLAGFAFEKSASPDEALRYYIESFDKGGHEGFTQQIAYLGQETGFQHDLVAQSMKASPDARPPGDGEGEILVVIQNGRSPFKVPERIPIGAFLVADVNNSRYRMTKEERVRADRVVAKGVLKFINFPVLRNVPPVFNDFRVSADGRRALPQLGQDVESSVLSAWEEDKGDLMFAAFTRMITRAIAGGATEAVTKESGLDKSLFPGASFLLGAAVEGVMAAKDTPDTRSWTMLPSDVRIYRLRVPAGEHIVTVRGSGRASADRKKRVEVFPGGFALVNFRFLN